MDKSESLRREAQEMSVALVEKKMELQAAQKSMMEIYNQLDAMQAEFQKRQVKMQLLGNEVLDLSSKLTLLGITSN